MEVKARSFALTAKANSTFQVVAELPSRSTRTQQSISKLPMATFLINTEADLIRGKELTFAIKFNDLENILKRKRKIF